MIKSITRITFKNQKEASNALTALQPELKDSARSETLLSIEGKELIINLKADDINAFRAVMNTYAKLVSVILKTQDVIDNA